MIFIKNKVFYDKVYDILVETGKALPRERHDFINAFMDEKYPTSEWRFGGLLGSGGKYRSYNKVTCYGEEETPERLKLIEEINEKLLALANKSRAIIYIDMDGVVADFDTEIKKVHPTIFEHEDGDYRGQVIDGICEADVNIFSRLQPLTGAIESVTTLQKHAEVYFLSTPMWGVPQSFTDKRLWIEQHFGDSAKKRLILTHRKDLNMGDYLIDDRLKNGAAEFKGKHIHFGSKDFPDWKSVIKYFHYKSLNFN